MSEDAPKQEKPRGIDTVLIVDDSQAALNLMSTALEGRNFNVITVTNGNECVDRFVNSEVQLVVLDYKLPDTTGIELLKKIRRFKTPEELPVLMITALQEKKVLHEAIKNGVNDFILKPTRANDFSKRVERLLVKVSNKDLQLILQSLNVADPSKFEADVRANLAAKNLVCYPFKIGDIECCAVLQKGKNPHSLAVKKPSELESELVLIAKGGFLWNTIWPRNSQPKFLVMTHILNDKEDLKEISLEEKL